MIRRNRSRSSRSPLRNRDRGIDRSKSPKNKNKRSPRSSRKGKKGKPRSKSRSRSRSPMSSRKGKSKKKSRANRVNDTDSTGKSKKKSKKNKRNRTVTSANDNDVLFNSSVANKEVYTSGKTLLPLHCVFILKIQTFVHILGDKIMVSVNFKNAANKSASEIAATKKPSLVIDVMSSPYQIIEPSPEPVFDIFSDEEKENNHQTNKTINDSSEKINDKEPGNPVEVIEELSRDRGPCTPPTENLDLAKGPQTPTEDPMDYDPCNPTESPIDDSLQIEGDVLIPSSPSSSGGETNGRDELLKTAANTIPFLIEESLVSNSTKGAGTAAEKNNDSNDLNDMPIDMDMDSPFSPQSSEGSDIFNPPSPKNKISHKKSKANGNIKSHKGNLSKSEMRLLFPILNFVNCFHGIFMY